MKTTGQECVCMCVFVLRRGGLVILFNILEGISPTNEVLWKDINEKELKTVNTQALKIFHLFRVL